MSINLSQGQCHSPILTCAAPSLLRCDATTLHTTHRTRPAKYFSIDRVFRNEAVDRTHLAEFHQVEGLVCDRGLTLGHLIATLQVGHIRNCVDRVAVTKVAPCWLHASCRDCLCQRVGYKSLLASICMHMGKAVAWPRSRTPGQVLLAKPAVPGVCVSHCVYMCVPPCPLQEFFSRLGMKELRFKPAFNPYTEPSMEIFG